MSSDFKINSSTYPSAFKWLESAISELDEKESQSNFVGSVVYLTTISFTVLTITADVIIGTVEAIFFVICKQDFGKALHVLKRKWLESTFQEMTS